MRLYDITDEYRALLEQYCDPELSQEELDVVADELAEKDAEWSDKARAVYGYMREQQESAEGVKSEIERLLKLQASHANAADRMKRYLQGEMIRLGLGKQDLGICKMWIQDNTPSVVVDAEVDGIDPEYVRVVPEKREIDKKRIAEDLKAGVEIPYAHLEATKSIRFR